MFLNVYNCIVFDEKADLVSCLKNQYLAAALTPREMAIIVPLIHDLLECENLEEFLIVSEWSLDYLSEVIPTSKKIFDTWSEDGLPTLDRYFLVFVVASDRLEDLRHHTCQACFAEYFSKEYESDLCDICAAEAYKHFFC